MVTKKNETAQKLSFIDHLEELRKRILISLVAIVISSTLSFFFASRILNFIIKWTGIETAYFFSPAEAFFVQIKIAIFVGIFIAFPIILYEIWAFIGPGLTGHEKKVSLPFLFSGIILFLCGLAFASFVLIPFGLKFLFSFGSENLRPLMNVNKVLEFILWCLLCCGILFELPLILFFLLKLGVIQIQTITRHRAELIVGILIVSAILTPTGDFFTLLLISIPLIILIELSILVARLTTKKGGSRICTGE
ncbi:MAG: twin-arginine translocase subunit TatC [candidate division WOR-3 bacterium]